MLSLPFISSGDRKLPDLTMLLRSGVGKDSSTRNQKSATVKSLKGDKTFKRLLISGAINKHWVSYMSRTCYITTGAPGENGLQNNLLCSLPQKDSLSQL